MINLPYVSHNKPYQKRLDSIYGGIVVSVDAYLNPRAIIKHYCFQCQDYFYGRPSFMLDDNNRHWCEARLPSQVNEKKAAGQKQKSTRGKVTPEMKRTMIEMKDNGVSMAEIARQMGVSREQVKYHTSNRRKKGTN